MTPEPITPQSTRLTCKIPTSLLLKVEGKRLTYMEGTGKRLTLRRVVHDALEAWASQQGGAL